MMAHVAFDTLAYANKLKAAGADPKLAEIQAEATAEILSTLVNEQLATKSDIKDLKIDIKELEMRLQATFFKMISAAVAILGGLQILFHFVK
ncbi:MAG: hypothetical protein ACD_45C00183G0014 [uncultured bacterium]|nr:MAG: hypothetical protein ACD_45C00183G0014 [uncultured bacterium]